MQRLQRHTLRQHYLHPAAIHLLPPKCWLVVTVLQWVPQAAAWLVVMAEMVQEEKAAQKEAEEEALVAGEVVVRVVMVMVVARRAGTEGRAWRCFRSGRMRYAAIIGNGEIN
ncbi:hypothetical protein CYMTET_4313 [Cymbomonas tetramitiformis]|uniref:Uncharacterized protein n=1 Tax=Cymbomonas tetramitiformis TaxID=36881 RepID=A0AAE0LK56_9CHLO|nr:hypothetical protein CYMTET_4313 [Cymbomonas tetramitiformis]